MTTKFVFNPLSGQFDLVTASISPGDVTGGTPNSVAGFDNTGALESVPGWAIDTTSGGLSQLETYQPNGLSQNTNLNSFEFNSDPLQNSPNETMTALAIGMSLDVNNNGFSQGTAGTAAGLLSLNLNHQGSSNIGSSYAISATPNFGNGTDPFTMQGWAYTFGFGTFNANVTIDGAIQGYGFQPDVNAAAISTANFNCNAFYDFATIGIPVHSYNAFSSSPNIASLANNSSYTGLTINPTIPTFTGNAGFTGVALAGNLGTIGTNGYQGVSINPTITAAGANNAVGLNISMLNVTGTNIQAINTSDGQVSFTNNNLKSGQPGLTASSTIDTSTSGAFGGVFGNNQLGGVLNIASGHPINGDFGFGNNLGVQVVAQDDMGPDASGLGLGFSMNGFVTSFGAATGKTFDTLNFMAAGASNTGTGADNGTFTNVNMFRALGLVPGGGAATVVNQIGFKVDSFFSSASPTNAWGFYCGDTNADNFLAKSLAIGTVTEKVTAGTTGLEIKTKDFVLDGGDQYITAMNAVGVVTNDSAGKLISVAPGTANNVLTSNGTAWISSPPSATTNLTNWVAYTPTFTAQSGTLPTLLPAFYWRRVGDTLEITGRLAFTSTNTWSGFTFSLPGGLTVDTAKSGDYTAGVVNGAEVSINPQGGGIYYGGLQYASTSELTVVLLGSAGSYQGIAAMDNTTPIAWLSGGAIYLRVLSIPISGWSATSVNTNTIPSLRAAGTPTIATFTTGTDAMIWSSLGANGYDTESAYNTTTGEYTIPTGLDGLWEINAGAGINGNGLIDYQADIFILVNGTQVAGDLRRWQATTTQVQTPKASIKLRLVATDVVTVSAVFNTDTGTTFAGADLYNFFEMTRLGQ